MQVSAHSVYLTKPAEHSQIPVPSHVFWYSAGSQQVPCVPPVVTGSPVHAVTHSPDSALQPLAHIECSTLPPMHE